MRAVGKDLLIGVQPSATIESCEVFGMDGGTSLRVSRLDGIVATREGCDDIFEDEAPFRLMAKEHEEGDWGGVRFFRR